MGHLGRDLRFAARQLLRKPGFAVATLLSLVLGIGLNTAVFTLLDMLLLRPLPVEDPASLAAVHVTLRDESGAYNGLYPTSHPNYLDLRERSRSFDGLAAHQWLPVNMTGGSEPVRATGMWVSGNYFDVLGLRPALGRFFLPEEDENPGTHPVVVLSHRCWSRHFGADAGILGRTVRVNGHPLTVVGVATRGFKGTLLSTDVDLWMPAMMIPVLSPYSEWFEHRGVALFLLFGRLRPGVSLEQADAEVMAIARDLEAAYPKVLETMGMTVRPLVESTLNPGDRNRNLGHVRLLAWAAGLILLIACFNVAHLLLVRGVERRHEIALRQSLGAGRGRVVRQLVTENLALFVAGAVLALPAGRLALQALWRFRPPEFAAEALDPELDLVVFGFALAVAVVTGLVFGLLPALRAARPDLVASLKRVEPAPSVGWPRWLRPRQLLVAGQLALTLVALIAAGLFLRSLQNAYRIDVGFDADSLLALTIAPGEQGYEEERIKEFYRRAVERVESLPGVESATVSENRLLRGGIWRRQVFLPGEQEPVRGGTFHRTNRVYAGYFETAGIPFVRGNGFDAVREDGPQAAVINQTMAEELWPGEDPVGRRFHFDYPTEPEIEVVGVVRDARYRHVHEDPQFFIYLPAVQKVPSAAVLHVRTRGDPAALLALVRSEVQALDPELPLADVGTLAEFVGEDLWLERAAASLLSAFAVLALALAAIGVYGVLAQAVTRKRREIGIRMAVGAGRGDLLRWVLGEGAAMIAAGLAAGLVIAGLAFKATTVVSSRLVDVDAVDPLTFAAAALTLFAVAFLGCLVPARRALRTDPVTTLREE